MCEAGGMIGQCHRASISPGQQGATRSSAGRHRIITEPTGQLAPKTLTYRSLWFPPLRCSRLDFYGNLRTLNPLGGGYPTPTSVAADEPGNSTINPTPVGVRVPRSFSKVHTRVRSRVRARDHIDRSAGLRSMRIAHARRGLYICI